MSRGASYFLCWVMATLLGCIPIPAGSADSHGLPLDPPYLPSIDSWINPTAHTDEQEKRNWHGCMYEEDDKERSKTLCHRAGNLAAAGHIKEAIDQMTQAVQAYPKCSANYIARACYYLRVNKDELARKDAETAYETKDLQRDQALIARLLLEVGEYGKCETALQQLHIDQMGVTTPFLLCTLALAEEKLGKLEQSIRDYRKAAGLFMSAGDRVSAERCAQHLSSLEGKPDNQQLNDMSALQENAAQVRALVETLFKSKHAFEVPELEGHLQCKLTASGNGYCAGIYGGVPPFRGVKLVSMERTYSGGNHLSIIFDNQISCFAEPVFSDLYQGHPNAKVPERWLPHGARTAAFKVPSGILELSYRAEGFKPLFQVDLYSDKKALVKAPIQVGRMTPERLIWMSERDGIVPRECLAPLLKSHPNNASVHTCFAKLLASEHDFGGALSEINRAIGLRENEPDNGCRQRVLAYLYLQRAQYLLETQKYQQAISSLQMIPPDQPDQADFYFARGQTYLALKKYKEAAQDLEIACSQFFESARIVRRDQALALIRQLKTLSSNASS